MTATGDEVRHHMSTELVTAGTDAPVAEPARLMLDRAVHRVIVLGAVAGAAGKGPGR